MNSYHLIVNGKARIAAASCLRFALVGTHTPSGTSLPVDLDGGVDGASARRGSTSTNRTRIMPA